MGTTCLDTCESLSSGEQVPRPSPLTSIISTKSPLRLAKTPFRFASLKNKHLPLFLEGAGGGGLMFLPMPE